MPGNIASAQVQPPNIPPKCPAKSTAPPRDIMTDMKVMMPTMQQSWDLILPRVFQLIVMQASNPPRVPKIMVEAPALITFLSLNFTDVMFPMYQFQIPARAEARHKTPISLESQHFYSLLKKNSIEMEFMTMWSKSTCRKAAVHNLHTSPFFRGLQATAPNFLKVSAVGARTRPLLVSIPCVRHTIQSVHIAMSKKVVTDNNFRVGHHTSISVQGIVSSRAGLVPTILFMKGTLFCLIYQFMTSMDPYYWSFRPIMGCRMGLLLRGLFRFMSLKPCTFAMFLYLGVLYYIQSIIQDCTKLTLHKYQQYNKLSTFCIKHMLTPPKHKQKAYSSKSPTVYELALSQAHRSKSPNYKSQSRLQKQKFDTNHFTTQTKAQIKPNNVKSNQMSKNRQINENSTIKSDKSRQKVNDKQKVEDLNGSRLISQLSKNRQNLSKKLDTYALIYELEDMNKCLKHNCYLSAYDKNSKMLMCIGCYNEKNSTNRSNESVKMSNNMQQLNDSPLRDMLLASGGETKYKTQSTNMSNKDRCTGCINLKPIQKSVEDVNKDIKWMRSQIEQQIMTIKRIQDILYEGFDGQQKQLQESIRLIDSKYEEVISQLKQEQRHAKDQMMRQYRVERNKHQFVLKELGLLRAIAQDQLSSLGRYISEQLKPSSADVRKQLLFKHNAADAQMLPTNAKINNSRYMPQAKIAHDESRSKTERDLIRKVTYAHLVLAELNNSIKFSKKGYNWHKSKHVNIIKNASQQHISKIDKILHQISATA